MTFQNFVCWRSEQVERILNVEATQPPDHIFLATHHPLTMKQSQLIKGGDYIRYSEQDFLRDFLAPKDFAFVPVLGSAGTGKSHLIRWLKAKIESTDSRKVLLIPKIGTNLKDVIRMILDIEGIEGHEFDAYRERLERATNSLTETEAREQLLNQLAIAVGDNGRHDRTHLSEVQNYLLEELRSLLYDPFFRKEWLKDGSVIHRLVLHTLGYKNTIEIIEERREFQIADLPLNINLLEKAGEQAQEFYSVLISEDEIQKATVDWLNRHLDEAITKVLDLGREDLQRLMREVRESLAEQGIELVLLIEDFAKLQGIDREVLEAVLARPQQPNSKPLCAIRTALACTTGYFESLIDTVQQRITFSVNLDLGTVSEQALVTEADIQQFVARYLNAVRLDDGEIQDWANSLKEDNSTNLSPPSFCDQCEHQQACHAGFGAVDNYGLYPFAPQAITQMLKRVNPDDFNPRVLIKDVLKYILENSVNDIEKGSFPSVSLRNHFGKMRLSALVQDDIRRRDPVNGDRREVLIDLWTNSDELVDLPTEVHTAFSLPRLKGSVKTVQPVVKEKLDADPYKVGTPSTNDIVETQLPEKLKQKINILDSWNNQEILTQEVEKDLREFIYPAVIERIEWDTELLLRGSFAGSSQIFKQRNVVFHSPRVTRITLSGIVLSLPLNPEDKKEFRETVIAFQGILLYSHYKNWNFPDGDRYFRTYAKHLDRWSQYILDEIQRRPRQSREPWNPIPATVELLAIAAQMSGHPTNSIEQLINSLFLELEDKDEASRTKTWKELFRVFKNNQEKLLEILNSRIGCTKGNSKDFQIIDAIQIVTPLKEVSKNWQLQCPIPDDLVSEYEVIHKVRQKVDELLLPAIEEERDRQLGIYQSLIAEFGEEIQKKQVIDTVNEALDKAREASVFGQKSAEKINEVITRFQKTKFMDYKATMQKIKAEIDKSKNNPTKLIQYLSENYSGAMINTSDFIEETNRFLDTSIKRAKEEISQLESSQGGNVKKIHDDIQNNLLKLQDLLKEI